VRGGEVGGFFGPSLRTAGTLARTRRPQLGQKACVGLHLATVASGFDNAGELVLVAHLPRRERHQRAAPARVPSASPQTATDLHPFSLPDCNRRLAQCPMRPEAGNRYSCITGPPSSPPRQPETGRRVDVALHSQCAGRRGRLLPGGPPLRTAGASPARADSVPPSDEIRRTASPTRWESGRM